MTTFKLMALAALIASAQANYQFIEESDYIDAGPNTFAKSGAFDAEKCATECDNDPLCQSFQTDLTKESCVLYHLRRCMTPKVHNNVARINYGFLYDKKDDVDIPANSVIFETNCGDYSGKLLDKTSAKITKVNLERDEKNIQAFKDQCALKCKTQVTCHSWNAFTKGIDNQSDLISAECSIYSDSIYSHPPGTYSVNEGRCVSTSDTSTYGIVGPAVSTFGCSAK